MLGRRAFIVLSPHMKHEFTKSLSGQEFKRLFGVERQTLKAMVEAMEEAAQLKGKGGAKAKLATEDQILMTLQYWREYRTYFHIAKDWGVSESTVWGTIQKLENVLIKSERFRLSGKKSLWAENATTVIAVDVTESPKRRQKRFYSGKKKGHTLKSQLVVDVVTLKIICTAYGKGAEHDFHLFKASRVHFGEKTQCLADKGYQGLQKLHTNSQIPIKKPRGGELSMEDKRFNRSLSRQRIVIEHVNRQIKIFKVISERYRNRHRRFGLRCNLIAAIYNYELDLAVTIETPKLL